jgi:hypothetical protein
MPIFKRYYIADIPGFGWLAKFYVTHYIHYIGAILLLTLIAFLVTQYMMVNRSRIKITASGYVRAAMLSGILISGAFMVIRNLKGVWMPPGFIIMLNLLHLGLVMAFIGTGFYCIMSRKPWTHVVSNGMQGV